MVYRAAAERLLDDEAVALPGDADGRYVVVGFNALSACEKRLFNRLKKSGRAEFYWDYDSYYVDHKDYEAGMFLRDNIRDYPPPPEARDRARPFRSSQRNGRRSRAFRRFAVQVRPYFFAGTDRPRRNAG